MDANQQWYYTDRNGQQAGPVGTAELRTLISQAAVTDTSMVWSEGMTDWKMLGQVEGLAQPAVPVAPQPTAIAQPPTATTPSAEINPYAPPTAVETAHPNMGGAFNHGLEYGGIRRLAYFGKIFMLFVLFMAVMFFSGFLFSGSSTPTLALALIGLLIFLVLYVRFALQRIKNIGTSGWWLLLMLVPIASNVLAIALLACPEGFADHKKMDTAGIVVAVILGALTLLSFFGNLAAAFA